MELLNYVKFIQGSQQYNDINFMQVLLDENLWFCIKKAVILVDFSGMKAESADVLKTL